MAAPDKVFQQTYAWYKGSIERLVAASAIPAAQQPAVQQMIWQMLGVLNPAAPPANPDLNDFKDNGAAAESLALACQVIGEALSALGYMKQAVDALNGGNPAAALGVVGPVMQQIDRLTQLQANSRYPSAFSIGKMLLMLTGDGQANPPAGHEADKLAALLGANSPADVANAQSALGIVTLLVGSMLDRSFTAPSSSAAAGFVTQAIPSFAGKPVLSLTVPGGGLNGTVAFDVGPPTTVKASITLALNRSQPIDGTGIELGFTANGSADVLIPVIPPGAVGVTAAYTVGLSLKRKGNALRIGSDAQGVTLSIDELGVNLQLVNGAPSLQFSATGAKVTLKPDGILKVLLGDGISVALDVAAQADAAGKLRLINGTGLHASLPVPTLPTGPFDLQLINLGLDPTDGSFTKLAVEVSISFGLALGPFAASVDRLGVLLKLDPGGANPIAFALKPPNGIGLSLDAGIVKGGGYLGVDGNGFAGILELKLLAVDVK
ncbi:MAG TPA: DUF6603 domain-containing protein, partial [Povalibacter sp.]|nr:DUF6603 domain-containing protein [Povalibacter sp.]